MPRLNKKFYPPYISWSRLNLFERSPGDYERTYLLGQGRSTPQMEFGSKIASALETGEVQDLASEFVRIAFAGDKSMVREFEIRADLDGIPVLGKLDGFYPKSMKIREYKTGKNWTQKMVDEHGQLTFYALLVYLKYGEMPKEIVLDWAETVTDDDGVRLTGRIESFKTQRKMNQVFSMCTRIKNAWNGIALLTKESRSKTII